MDIYEQSGLSIFPCGQFGVTTRSGGPFLDQQPSIVDLICFPTSIDYIFRQDHS
jgi:hypothetical protein